MKKILLLTTEFPPFRGGIGTYTWQLALATHELGHSVTVVAPDYDGDHAATDPRDYPFEVIRYAGGIYGAADLVPMLWRLWSLVRQDTWDVIHAVDWPSLLGMDLVRRFAPRKFLATAYGTEVLGVLGSRHVRMLAGGRLFGSPARIMAISEYTRTLLLEHCPEVSPDRVDITPLGVNARFFAAQDEETVVAARDRYGIPADRRIILTVSRLDERKGHRVALQALAGLSAGLKEQIAYVIAGQGGEHGYVDELKTLAADCGVPVIFAGRVADEDLVALYAGADIFCMPGEPHPEKVEGFGLVYLEAAAQGVPSLASRYGAVPEVVRHEETGLLVPPRDVTALTECLTALLEDPERLRNLGDEARTFAGTFTWERCARLSYEI